MGSLLAQRWGLAQLCQHGAAAPSPSSTGCLTVPGLLTAAGGAQLRHLPSPQQTPAQGVGMMPRGQFQPQLQCCVTPLVHLHSTGRMGQVRSAGVGHSESTEHPQHSSAPRATRSSAPAQGACPLRKGILDPSNSSIMKCLQACQQLQKNQSGMADLERDLKPI